ncbi:hypothetical protein ACH79_01000 [Bradyrhizobium sp. CCBAU 051011]|nr:hypothetical protein ACH79_01000 [Bradyrhizobium sp. CCBAU 051011]
MVRSGPFGRRRRNLARVARRLRRPPSSRAHHDQAKAYFRNSLDMTSKVQVKVLRRRLKLSNVELAAIVRKTGNSISAISKEAVKT